MSDVWLVLCILVAFVASLAFVYFWLLALKAMLREVDQQLEFAEAASEPDDGIPWL